MLTKTERKSCTRPIIGAIYKHEIPKIGRIGTRYRRTPHRRSPPPAMTQDLVKLLILLHNL